MWRFVKSKFKKVTGGTTVVTERKQVLEMLASGEISVEETERLLTALGETPSEPGLLSAGESPKSSSPKFLRILVEPDPAAGDSAPVERVNVRVPIAIIRAGVKLSSLVPDDARDHIDRALSSKGINFDTKSIDSESLNDLIDAIADIEVDVTNGSNHVRVFAE